MQAEISPPDGDRATSATFPPLEIAGASINDATGTQSKAVRRCTISPKRDYFDLITEGVGYLNQVRSVHAASKRGAPFLACEIRAFSGPGDKIDYRTVDLIVVGSQAIAVCRKLQVEVDADKAVIVGFRFGDVKPDQHMVRVNKTEREPRLRLKGRLLEITFAKVDGLAFAVEPRQALPESTNRMRTGTAG
jgi:Protein of unknown function (DUF3577)